MNGSDNDKSDKEGEKDFLSVEFYYQIRKKTFFRVG